MNGSTGIARDVLDDQVERYFDCAFGGYVRVEDRGWYADRVTAAVNHVRVVRVRGDVEAAIASVCAVYDGVKQSVFGQTKEPRISCTQLAENLRQMFALTTLSGDALDKLRVSA